MSAVCRVVCWCRAWCSAVLKGDKMKKYKTTLYNLATAEGSQGLRLASFNTSADAVEWGLLWEGRTCPTDLGHGVLPYVVGHFVVRQWCDSSEDWYPLGDCPCMEWSKDAEGNWGRVGDCADNGDGWAGQAFASALGSDPAPVCWCCGVAERVGDYCRGCLSMQ